MQKPPTKDDAGESVAAAAVSHQLHDDDDIHYTTRTTTRKRQHHHTFSSRSLLGSGTAIAHARHVRPRRQTAPVQIEMMPPSRPRMPPRQRLPYYNENQICVLNLDGTVCIARFRDWEDVRTRLECTKLHFIPVHTGQWLVVDSDRATASQKPRNARAEKMFGRDVYLGRYYGPVALVSAKIMSSNSTAEEEEDEK